MDHAARACFSGDDIIHDRLVFAATNYKPLKKLRDAWVSEASSWAQQHRALKRAFEYEVEKQKLHAAPASVAAPVSADGALPAKRM